MSNISFEDVPVVLPPDNRPNTTIARLQKFIEDRYKIKIGDYWSFHKWSVDCLPEYWGSVWDFCGIISAKTYDEVIDPTLPISELSSWFKGAMVNYGENMLKYRDDRIAFITAGEDSDIKRITYAQMYEEVKLYAAAFRRCGLKKGDLVACYMPNRVEPVFAMIAAASIGAIFTGTLPMFGPEAVINRLEQVQPKFLLTLDRYMYEGKEIEMLQKVKVISETLSLKKVLVVASKGKYNRPDITFIKNGCFLDDFLECGRDQDGSVPPLVFEYVTPSHPVFLCFTSGTTGAPKPLLSGFGILLSVANNFKISFNSNRDSVWLSMSSPGWATWNLFATLPFFGGSLVLFESAPYFLSKTFFWDLIDELKISHLIVAPSVTNELEKRGIVPTKKHSLESLKLVCNGGSVVKPEIYDFYLKKVKRDIWFAACYATTETMGGLATLQFSLPVHKGEIPAKCLGFALEVVDEEGNPVLGEVGHVVLTKSVPSLLLGILGDEDGSAVKEKYFLKFPGKFDVGDLAIINPKTNGLYIVGRSDTTLKQRGCRFGSSDIYPIVDKFEEVRDSICVSKYNEKMEESAVLFLQMRPGYSLDEDLVSKIRTSIATALTLRHVPDFILETGDIPYNMTDKKMESLVKNIINNRPYKVSDARNPDALNNFVNRPELNF